MNNITRLSMFHIVYYHDRLLWGLERSIILMGHAADTSNHTLSQKCRRRYADCRELLCALNKTSNYFTDGFSGTTETRTRLYFVATSECRGKIRNSIGH